MIDDPDVYRAAAFLLDQYGEGAVAIAAARAEKLFREGDMAGWKIWRTTLKGMRELLTTTRSRGETEH